MGNKLSNRSDAFYRVIYEKNINKFYIYNYILSNKDGYSSYQIKND